MKLKTIQITICDLHAVDLPIYIYELISEIDVDEDRETDRAVKPMSPETAAIYHGDIDGDFNY